MAVTIDTGDEVLLHPKNKKPIGVRHAYLALGKTYGFPLVHQGPVFSNFKVEGKKMLLNFTSSGSGPTGGREANIFALAGKDRVWHWAKAKIKENAVVLTSNKVKNPVAARYGGDEPFPKKPALQSGGLPSLSFPNR